MKAPLVILTREEMRSAQDYNYSFFSSAAGALLSFSEAGAVSDAGASVGALLDASVVLSELALATSSLFAAGAADSSAAFFFASSELLLFSVSSLGFSSLELAVLPSVWSSFLDSSLLQN